MAAKFYPTPEQLDTIMTMYANGSSYAAIGREVGISGAVAKRVITDFNTGDNPIKKPEKNKSKDMQIQGWGQKEWQCYYRKQKHHLIQNYLNQ